MAAPRTVRVVLTVTVDPDAWSEIYGTGTDRATIANDVRAYVLNGVQQSAAALEGAVTDVEEKS